MSVESDLKKDGIVVIKKLDTLRVNTIARNVAIRLCETFPDFGLNQNDLFIKLSRLDMYIAKMPEGMAEANYFYKNTSIYFNDHIADDDLEEFAIHECIHYIQEIKDKMLEFGAIGSLMSGSGPTVFGLFTNPKAAQEAYEELRYGESAELAKQVYLTNFYNQKEEKNHGKQA